MWVQRVGVVVVCLTVGSCGGGGGRPEAGPARPRPSRLVRPVQPELAMLTRVSGPVGQAPPDFALPDVRTGKTVRLSEVAGGRPLVLIFGSWGCDIFCGQLGRLVELHADYGVRADVLFVQVADAPHPYPEGLTGAYAAAGMSEETAGNRLRRAALAAEVMRWPVRHLLDDEGHSACYPYKAFPQRLYIIHGGKVAYDSGPGLFGPVKGWDMEAVRARLDDLLSDGPDGGRRQPRASGGRPARAGR